MTAHYPEGWPACACGAPVLDGHLTCGDVACDEALERDRRQLTPWMVGALEAMRAAARGEPVVGAIAIATRRTGVCELGERGVCYEVYELLEGPVRNDATTRPGYSFIFQSGRYDGFSPDEVRLMLTLTGEVCAAVADYQFKTVMHLERDFGRGVFDAALAQGAHAGGTRLGAQP